MKKTRTIFSFLKYFKKQYGTKAMQVFLVKNPHVGGEMFCCPEMITAAGNRSHVSVMKGFNKMPNFQK